MRVIFTITPGTGGYKGAGINGLREAVLPWREYETPEELYEGILAGRVGSGTFIPCRAVGGPQEDLLQVNHIITVRLDR